MAINLNDDLTTKAKKGWKYYFGIPQGDTLGSHQDSMIIELEERGLEYNKERNTTDNQIDIENIRQKLIDDPEYISTVKTVLGI